MIGALGADGLQEYTYDALAKEPAFGGPATKGKAWNGVTGGFVGITDKYWAAAAIPAQDAPYTGSFTERTDGATKVYQASVRADARSVEARRHGLGDAKPVCRRQGSERHQRLRARSRDQEVRPDDRLGVVLLHH